MKKKISKT